MAQPWHGRLAWYELMTTDPKAGRFAVLSDPQGAVFALLQPADPAAYSGSETVPAPLEFS